MRAWLVMIASVARVAAADPADLSDRAGLPDDALHLVGGFGFDLGRIAAGRVPERRRVRESDVLARGDLWIEPAIGYELASRPNEPVLGRADVSLAIGYQQTRHEPGSWNGSYAAVRVIARDGDDVSVLFTSGVVFGN